MVWTFIVLINLNMILATYSFYFYYNIGFIGIQVRKQLKIV